MPTGKPGATSARAPELPCCSRCSRAPSSPSRRWSTIYTGFIAGSWALALIVGGVLHHEAPNRGITVTITTAAITAGIAAAHLHGFALYFTVMSPLAMIAAFYLDNDRQTGRDLRSSSQSARE